MTKKWCGLFFVRILVKNECRDPYESQRSNNITPWKINMEPTNHPFGKENDLPNLHDYVTFHVNLLRCTLINNLNNNHNHNHHLQVVRALAKSLADGDSSGGSSFVGLFLQDWEKNHSIFGGKVDHVNHGTATWIVWWSKKYLIKWWRTKKRVFTHKVAKEGKSMEIPFFQGNLGWWNILI